MVRNFCNENGMVQYTAIITNVKIIWAKYSNYIFFVNEIEYFFVVRNCQRKLEFDNYIKIVLCNRRGTVQKLKENKPQRKGKNRGCLQKLGPRHEWRHHLVKALSLRNLREKILEWIEAPFTIFSQNSSHTYLLFQILFVI